MIKDRSFELAESIIKNLSEKKTTVAFAESCTGGFAASLLARIPGASNVLWGSFVTYTDDAKVKMLGVPEELIRKHGAVSQAVALTMAEGALEKSGAFMVVSITGLAGPDGDCYGTPAGTVWIGLARLDEGRISSEVKCFHFTGERNEIREAAAITALELIIEHLNLSPR